MPLITGRSLQRPWVHQETGYALGINIPVLPVALNTLPGQMITELQAITIAPDMSDLETRLQEARLEELVTFPPMLPVIGTQVAEIQEQRTLWLVRCAN